MSKVFFLKSSDKDEIVSKLGKLFDKVFSGFYSSGDKVAVKLHFGERGNTRFVKPKFVKPLVDELVGKGADCFLTDTNALYSGSRTFTKDHIALAKEHGFDSVGVPIKIAGGESGEEHVDVDIGRKHFEKVHIAKEFREVDKLFFISHFKGHMLAGFGGSIKNASMGCAIRAGKQQMHSDMKPKVDASKCVMCGKCIANCPVKAISSKEGKAFIDSSICIGCGQCTGVCPVMAIPVRWDTPPSEFLEKMAEYAYGAVKDMKVGYVNFLINIAPNCDCLGHSDEPMVPDIGVLAGFDPVALDSASYDLVCKVAGKDVFKEIHGMDATVQLKHGEEIGLGNRNYELVDV